MARWNGLSDDDFEIGKERGRKLEDPLAMGAHNVQPPALNEVASKPMFGK